MHRDTARTRARADAPVPGQHAHTPTSDLSVEDADPAEYLRLHDPSLTPRPGHRPPPRTPNGGVAWVRAADALSDVTSRAAGQGIATMASVSLWSRSSLSTAATATRDRLSRLAPLAAFGLRSHAPVASRSAISR